MGGAPGDTSKTGKLRLTAERGWAVNPLRARLEMTSVFESSEAVNRFLRSAIEAMPPRGR